MRQKRRWRKVLYFFLGLGLAYVVGCYYLASKYVRPGTTNGGSPAAGFHESSHPNAWLSANLVNPGSPTTTFVLVHGYGGSQFGWNSVSSELSKKGYGVIIPALPGHDNLTADTSGFAVKESAIVRETARWVKAQTGGKSKVVVVGISMGGAACWLASVNCAEIDAIATEGCFARLEPATKQWFDRKAPGASTYLYPVIWFAKRMTGVDPATVNPVEAAAKWKGKPALIIHGDLDALFATTDAHALAEASGGEFWSVSGATHAHCSDVALDEYVKRLEKLADLVPKPDPW